MPPNKWQANTDTRLTLKQFNVPAKEARKFEHEYAQSCPHPSNEEFLALCIERFVEPHQERCPPVPLDWRPDAVTTSTLKEAGYSEALILHAADLFVMQQRESSSRAISYKAYFVQFVKTRFPQKDRQSKYGWYPSAAAEAELALRGVDREAMLNALNEYRQLPRHNHNSEEFTQVALALAGAPGAQ